MAASLISHFWEILLSELFGDKFVFFDAYSHAKDCFVAQFVIILLQSLNTPPGKISKPRDIKTEPGLGRTLLPDTAHSLSHLYCIVGNSEGGEI